MENIAARLYVRHAAAKMAGDGSRAHRKICEFENWNDGLAAGALNHRAIIYFAH